LATGTKIRSESAGGRPAFLKIVQMGGRAGDREAKKRMKMVE
jgi:hypothetical protein